MIAITPETAAAQERADFFRPSAALTFGELAGVLSEAEEALTEAIATARKALERALSTTDQEIRDRHMARAYSVLEGAGR